MGLDKAIEYGKEHRKQYRGAKHCSMGCRNHGSCDFCKSNRLYKFLKCEEQAKSKRREYQ